MLAPTVFTWILVGLGFVFIVLLLLYAQLLTVLQPQSRRTKDLVIGKGEDWRDRTHFRFAYGAAWADLVVQLPLLSAGSIGVLLGQAWGYLLWAGAGAILVYISLILWFVEREYVYPAWGPWAYYSFYWGFPVYWGIAVVVYSVLRLSGVFF